MGAGFLETIKNNKNYKILASADTQGQIERALPKVDKIIEEYQNIDIVMGLNDPAAMGALAAIDSKGAREGVLVYGIDGSPDLFASSFPWHIKRLPCSYLTRSSLRRDHFCKPVSR